MSRTLYEPIRQSTLVRSDQAHTFDVFVRRIGDWWPTRPFSIGIEKVVAVAFERELGGRVYETWEDGTEVDWGRVIEWDPPNQFTMTWELFSAPTEVELTFKPLGPALTRVEVEHRGWERLPEEEVRACTAIVGGYSGGWATVLSTFGEAVTPSAD